MDFTDFQCHFHGLPIWFNTFLKSFANVTCISTFIFKKFTMKLAFVMKSLAFLAEPT